MASQENYFAGVGGDAYFRRNLAGQQSERELPGLSTKITDWALERESAGSICVFGGTSGAEAAFFSSALIDWRVVNVDISQDAIDHGRNIFPYLEHIVTSLTAPELAKAIGTFDCVLLTGILCWLDRFLLSRAILNIDEVLKPGGLLAIYDFFPTSPRVNPISHADGVFTYKQDYSRIFDELGIFDPIAFHVEPNGDARYHLEDQLHGYSILRKHEPHTAEI